MAALQPFLQEDLGQSSSAEVSVLRCWGLWEPGWSLHEVGIVVVFLLISPFIGNKRFPWLASA